MNVFVHSIISYLDTPYLFPVNFTPVKSIPNFPFLPRKMRNCIHCGGHHTGLCGKVLNSHKYAGDQDHDSGGILMIPFFFLMAVFYMYYYIIYFIVCGVVLVFDTGKDYFCPDPNRIINVDRNEDD